MDKSTQDIYKELGINELKDLMGKSISVVSREGDIFNDFTGTVIRVWNAHNITVRDQDDYCFTVELYQIEKVF